MKSDNRKINANFQNNKIPKEVSQFIFLSVILIGSDRFDRFLEQVKNYL